MHFATILFFFLFKKGFPGGSEVKNLPASAGDSCLIPGSGRSSEEGNGNTLQYSCLGNPIDRGTWRAKFMGLQRVGHDWVTKQQRQQLFKKGPKMQGGKPTDTFLGKEGAEWGMFMWQLLFLPVPPGYYNFSHCVRSSCGYFL